jgi:hypothetical protein
MLTNKTIDIVLPWVNPLDKEWQSEFIAYKRLAGDKSDNRFRDAGTLPYWFKLIRKNTQFNYRIVLIVASESQLPKWLNKSDPDLRIVYHTEFIPKHELPTFSSNVINCYIPFISDLNEHYILFNDDIFMVRPTTITDWFLRDLPKFHIEHRKFPRKSDCVWDLNIANSQLIINTLFNAQLFIVPEHAALPHKRSIDLFVWSKIGRTLQSIQSNSKFRYYKNVTDWLFSMFYVASGNYIPADSISTYYNKSTIGVPTTKLVCYNDTELITDYEQYVHNLHSTLSQILSM